MKPAKVALYAGIGAAVLALIAVVFLAYGASTQLNDLHRGAEEGYELRGTYFAGEDRMAYLTFQERDGEKQWQHRDARGTAITDGLYEETGDPNLYTLLDADGNETGWAHLAYVNAQAEGVLFYSLNFEKAAMMHKGSAVAMTMETPAE
jgi:hypothetical protein